MEALLKKQQTLSILNLLAVLFAIGINYYSQIHTIHGNRVSDMSDEYNNLFTPAGYAFSIWGIIFIAIFIFAIYQIYRTFVKKKTFDFISQTGLWFVLANVGNGLWVITWLYDYTWVSVVIMLVILFSLIKIVVNTNMELSSVPEAWTIALIVIATGLNLILIATRGMREFAVVGAWALIAIYVRHQFAYETIAITSLVGAILILVSVFVHAYMNRRLNPFYGKYFR